MPSKGIGVLIGKWEGVLDHLVPICDLMEMPLLISDPQLLHLAAMFYPEIELIPWDEKQKSLDGFFLEQYSTVAYAGFCRLPHGGFRFTDSLFHGKKRSLFCPHGNTDKRNDLYWLERIADEDVVLAYGPQMLEMLKAKGVWGRFSKAITTGNYRYAYYQKHKAFFDGQVNKQLTLDPAKKSVLYAPTWTSEYKVDESRVDYSTVFEIYPHLFENVPKHFQLIVKWHPLLLENYPDRIDEIEAKYPHIQFLRHFPLVYPLLEKTDIFIGDYSSMGYDFLLYDRPLFLLPAQKRDVAYLHSCGKVLDREELPYLYEVIEDDQSSFAPKRQQAYAHAFGEAKPLENLRKEIEAALYEN